MKDKSFILRKDNDKSDQGFANLRRLGIAYAQSYSGEHWTDFNDHDPGVTILEQAVFGPNELNYLVDRTVPELLSNDRGDIPWQSLGLVMPEEIYPCRATTLADLRLVLLDQLIEVSEVWLDYDRSNQNTLGLINILVHPRSKPSSTRAEQHTHEQLLRTQIMAIFSANRNMAEDIGSIEFATEANIQLHASLELDDNYLPADVLAKVFVACRSTISTPTVPMAFDEVSDSGMTLESALTGPATHSGVYLTGDSMTLSDSDVTHVPVSVFYAALKALRGVRKVEYVRFYWHGKDIGASLPVREKNVVAQISLPQSSEDNHVILT